MAISTADQASLKRAEQAKRRHSAAWVWQVTALSMVLGVLLALALKTEFNLRSMGIPPSGRGARAAAAVSLKQSNDRLEEEVKRLGRRNAEVETLLAKGSQDSTALSKELSELRLKAGLVPVSGPGLIITLRDSKEKGPDELIEQLTLHDSDVNLILSELKVAGAEAIGISGADTTKVQRVIARTAARCTGPGMDINDTRLGAPYHIFAIGNPKELSAQLNMRGGVVDKLELSKLGMIDIKETPRLTIPEYTGSFSFKHVQLSDPAR